MDSFSIESKEYQVTESDNLPDGWEDMSLDERIELLFED